MKKLNIKYTISLVLLGLFLLPGASHAYVTTKQTALRLNENTLLFTITYQFGFEQYDVYLPIASTRQSGSSKTPGSVEYKVLKNGKLTTDVGKTYSVVLSSAQVKDNQYFVPKGEARKFTLTTLLVLPEERPASSTDFAIKATSLPFTMIDDAVEVLGRLNDTELKPYVTPVVSTVASK